MEIKRLANSYLVIALILGALLPVMLDLSSNINIYEFLFLTYFISVFVSLGFVLVSGKKSKLMSYIKNKKTFAIIAAIGILNYALLEFGITYAEHFVSASLATVVYRTSPLLMLLFLPIVLREKISKYQIAALMLGFVGLYIAASGGSLQLLAGSNLPIIALLIGIALAGALATVLVKKYAYDMESCMFIFNIANFVLFGALFVANGIPTSIITTANIVSILYVGIIYNVFVGFMYYGSLRILKTTFVTNIYFLSPFITFIFASLILGEPIQAYYLAIALLVSAGILIQKLDKTGGTYRADTKNNFTIFDVTGAFVNSGEVGISSAINDGGRVLATSIDARYKDHFDSIVKNNDYANIFTDKQLANHESVFVKDILGADESNIVILKAGKPQDGEVFFSHLSKLINTADENPKRDLPDEQN